MNYYERHLGDYAKNTGHLSPLEHGVYTLLLDRYYATEQAIPADQAYRLARARTRAEKRAVDVVLDEFFTLQDGLYRCVRADKEISRKDKRAVANQENGKLGGRPKKEPDGKQIQSEPEPNQNPIKTQTEPNQNPNRTQTEPNQNPIKRQPVTSNQKPETKEKAKSKASRARQNETQTEPDQNPIKTQTQTQTSAIVVDPACVEQAFAKQNPEKNHEKTTRKRDGLTLQQAFGHDAANGGTGWFIREDDPVFEWAQSVGLPDEYVDFAWEEFKRRFLNTPKRQKDWRAHFRNACRRDWLGLWRLSSQGEYYLTQAGKQLERELNAKWERDQQVHAVSITESDAVPDDGFGNSDNLIAHLFGSSQNPLSADKWLN